MNDVMSYLFETKAIKFCEENKPFWYTSGKIGPYFINTHFIYGNEEDAKELLNFIDNELSNKIELLKNVFAKVLEQYNSNKIYKYIIDTMIDTIKKNINISEVDYISGGERRDWFFSNIIAYLLDKPHISIYKDLSTVVSDSKFKNTTILDKIDKKRILHIADLITVASSYIRAWIPAIENLGSKMCWSCVVVDRMQGGTQKISEYAIMPLSLVKVDETLFEKAFNMNIINEVQQQMLNNFFISPDETMRQFLITYPKFLEDSLNSLDEKTRKRAQLLLDKDLYELK